MPTKANSWIYILIIHWSLFGYLMTGYSHSYHWIRLIHCGAPQRDVLSDNMVFWVVTQKFLFHALPVLFIKYCYELCIQRQMVVTQSFYFILCQSSLWSTVICFVHKDKLWFDESMSVIFCMENTWKRILLFPLHIELNLKTLLCNWRDSP